MNAWLRGALGLVLGVLVAMPLTTLTVAALGGEDRHAGLVADDLQLLHRVRALQVSRDEHRRVLLADEPLRELAREGSLTGALETDEHDHRRRALRELQLARFVTTEDVHEFVVDDLHDLLRRVERPAHLVAQGALAHVRGELLDDGQCDVGLEQRATDLADGAVNVGGRELALRAQIAERVDEAV